MTKVGSANKHALREGTLQMSGGTGSNRPRSEVFRYTLELDLHVFFTPLMQDGGTGIVMTRTLQLPFPPADKIAIGGQSIDGDCQVAASSA